MFAVDNRKMLRKVSVVALVSTAASYHPRGDVGVAAQRPASVRRMMLTNSKASTKSSKTSSPKKSKSSKGVSSKASKSSSSKTDKNSGSVRACGETLHGEVSLDEDVTCNTDVANVNGVYNAALTLAKNAVLDCQGHHITQVIPNATTVADCPLYLSTSSNETFIRHLKKTCVRSAHPFMYLSFHTTTLTQCQLFNTLHREFPFYPVSTWVLGPQ